MFYLSRRERDSVSVATKLRYAKGTFELGIGYVAYVGGNMHYYVVLHSSLC